MTPPVPQITSLCEEYPYPISNLVTNDLIMKPGTTVSIVVIESAPGTPPVLGVWFCGEEHEVTIFFLESHIPLTSLPPVNISTQVMAQAAMPRSTTAFCMKTLSEHVFAAAICMLGKITLGLNDGNKENPEIDIKLEIGTETASTSCLLSSLSEFLEPFNKKDGSA